MRERDADSDRLVELPPPWLHCDHGGHRPALLLQLLAVLGHLHHAQPDTDLLGQRLPGEVTLEAGAEAAGDLASLLAQQEDLLLRSRHYGKILWQVAGCDAGGHDQGSAGQV